MLHNYTKKKTKAASLAVFRVLFGFLMAFSMLRFWYNGWIEKLYLLPKFHFHYSGFEFINVPGDYTYFIFILCFLASILVAIGFQYRLAIILFFISFTYIELLDKTTYLNHYYFVSVIGFMMIWLPAHCTYSIDAFRYPSLSAEYIPSWTVDAIKVMLAIVYIYAGLAKLNPDWMLDAMPLTLWLPTKGDIPLLGWLMHEKWIHYLFSWGGAAYDICIIFFLLWTRTRVWAFVMVIAFHILTRVLFPIGMFPFIMIASTIIFFGSDMHEKILNVWNRLPLIKFQQVKNGKTFYPKKTYLIIVGLLLLIQLLLPLRHLALTDNVYWTEQGYRFSWRVMLMEKTGYANFKIMDGQTKKWFYVQNDDFLTSLQEKQMSTQPDFILEYAQYLGDHFTLQGHQNVEVYVESYAALNGRKSQRYIDHTINLLSINYSDLCNNYITPLNE